VSALRTPRAKAEDISAANVGMPNDPLAAGLAPLLVQGRVTATEACIDHSVRGESHAASLNFLFPSSMLNEQCSKGVCGFFRCAWRRLPSRATIFY
jgi:hypothetical protein